MHFSSTYYWLGTKRLLLTGTQKLLLAEYQCCG